VAGREGAGHDAVDATTSLVGEGQASVARNVLRATDPLLPLAAPVRLVTGAVGVGAAGTLGAVRLVNRVVEGLSDTVLDGLPTAPDPEEPPIALRSDALGTSAWVADAALGAVNGAVGDHLAARRNGLDLGLRLRSRDRYLDPAAPIPVGPVSDTLVVLVHGLGTTEWSWCLDAAAYHGDASATFGSMLERDLGATPIFVRYDTGRPIPDSARELAQRLEDLCAAWPVPLARVVLLGHSMGGLVARAACHAASASGHRWLGAVDLVISLGTPHRGAPLARAGESVAASLGLVDLPATRVLARILAARSAGIRHLEHGEVGVGLVGRGPGVGVLPHRGRRRDRVDGDELGHPVRDVRDGFVGVPGAGGGAWAGGTPPPGCASPGPRAPQALGRPRSGVAFAITQASGRARTIATPGAGAGATDQSERRYSTKASTSSSSRSAVSPMVPRVRSITSRSVSALPSWR
jgi:hypothetical protein